MDIGDGLCKRQNPTRPTKPNLDIFPIVVHDGHMPTMDTLPITTREVADILGIGRRQVLRLINSGVIPTLGKLDGGTGAHLFNRAAIEALDPQPSRPF